MLVKTEHVVKLIKYPNVPLGTILVKSVILSRQPSSWCSRGQLHR